MYQTTTRKHEEDGSQITRHGASHCFYGHTRNQSGSAQEGLLWPLPARSPRPGYSRVGRNTRRNHDRLAVRNGGREAARSRFPGLVPVARRASAGGPPAGGPPERSQLIAAAGPAAGRALTVACLRACRRGWPPGPHDPSRPVPGKQVPADFQGPEGRGCLPLHQALRPPQYVHSAQSGSWIMHAWRGRRFALIVHRAPHRPRQQRDASRESLGGKRRPGGSGCPARGPGG